MLIYDCQYKLNIFYIADNVLLLIFAIPFTDITVSLHILGNQ